MDHAEIRLAKLVASVFNIEYVVLGTYSGVGDDVVDPSAWGERGGLFEELDVVPPFRDVALDEFSPTTG